MSSDGEITAMRAAGVSGRRVAPPILAFGFLMTLVAAAASLWLTPWSIRERSKIQNQLISGQLTAEVQARVFQEQFPNSILYISDIPVEHQHALAPHFPGRRHSFERPRR